MNELPFEIWMTQGQGGMKIAAFQNKDEAQFYLDRHLANDDGSYALMEKTNE